MLLLFHYFPVTPGCSWRHAYYLDTPEQLIIPITPRNADMLQEVAVLLAAPEVKVVL